MPQTININFKEFRRAEIALGLQREVRFKVRPTIEKHPGYVTYAAYSPPDKKRSWHFIELNSEQKNYATIDALNCSVLHELRHAYQWETTADPQWTKLKDSNYETCPLEIDANEWSLKHHKRFKIVKKTLRSRLHEFMFSGLLRTPYKKRFNAHGQAIAKGAAKA